MQGGKTTISVWKVWEGRRLDFSETWKALWNKWLGKTIRCTQTYQVTPVKRRGQNIYTQVWIQGANSHWNGRWVFADSGQHPQRISHCPVSLTADKWKAWLRWAGDEDLTVMSQSAPQGLRKNDRGPFQESRKTLHLPNSGNSPSRGYTLSHWPRNEPIEEQTLHSPTWKTGNPWKNLTRREMF